MTKKTGISDDFQITVTSEDELYITGNRDYYFKGIFNQKDIHKLIVHAYSCGLGDGKDLENRRIRDEIHSKLGLKDY